MAWRNSWSPPRGRIPGRYVCLENDWFCVVLGVLLPVLLLKVLRRLLRLLLCLPLLALVLLAAHALQGAQLVERTAAYHALQARLCWAVQAAVAYRAQVCALHSWLRL